MAMPQMVNGSRVEFEFEKMNVEWWRERISIHWDIPYFICGIYLLLVFGSKRIMKNRKPFDLKQPLIIWNSSLAAFSIIGTYRIGPDIMNNLFHNGIYNMTCTRLPQSGLMSFWIFAFTISKIFELFDTFFITLRKKNLIFLHWYHHVSVLLISFHNYPYDYPIMWTYILNYFVHAVMYSYYAIVAAGFKIPKNISMSITMLQMSQFLAGFCIFIYAMSKKMNGEGCEAEMSDLVIYCLLGISYFVLFGNFFRHSYGAKGKKILKSE